MSVPVQQTTYHHGPAPAAQVDYMPSSSHDMSFTGQPDLPTTHPYGISSSEMHNAPGLPLSVGYDFNPSASSMETSGTAMSMMDHESTYSFIPDAASSMPHLHIDGLGPSMPYSRFYQSQTHATSAPSFDARYSMDFGPPTQQNQSLNSNVSHHPSFLTPLPQHTTPAPMPSIQVGQGFPCMPLPTAAASSQGQQHGTPATKEDYERVRSSIDKLRDAAPWSSQFISQGIFRIKFADWYNGTDNLLNVGATLVYLDEDFDWDDIEDADKVRPYAVAAFNIMIFANPKLNRGDVSTQTY